MNIESKVVDLEEMKKLLEGVDLGCGFKGEVPDFTVDFDIKCKGEPLPGCRVKIYWHDFIEDDEKDGSNIDLWEYDRGYVFTLPGYDNDDILMSGIVHIPLPIGGEKEQCEPEWITIVDLLTNDRVRKVIFED